MKTLLIAFTVAMLISSTAFAQQYDWIQQQQMMMMQRNMAQQNLAAQRQLMMEMESRQRVRDSQDGLNQGIRDISRPNPVYIYQPRRW